MKTMEKLKNIKLIATDFDQTLFLPEMPFPRETIESIEALHQLDVKFAIVSGRSSYEMELLLKSKDINWANPFPDFLICNEKFILDPYGNELSEKTEEWNQKVKSKVFKFDNIIYLALEIIEELKAKGIEIERYSASSEEGINIDFPSPKLAEQARELIIEITRGRLKNLTLSGNLYTVSVVPEWPNKADTLKFLANEMLGISDEQVLAIGDHLNDIPMLNGSYGFVCATVDNAHPQVKSAVRKAGGIIAEKIGPAGVGEILKEIYSLKSAE